MVAISVATTMSVPGVFRYSSCLTRGFWCRLARGSSTAAGGGSFSSAAVLPPAARIASPSAMSPYCSFGDSSRTSKGVRPLRLTEFTSTDGLLSMNFIVYHIKYCYCDPKRN
ncbi:ankyrin repeat-containing protein-like [Iris pallida]|uniref:Ankyrin repeat-containing protein-like n=1 Tax=Iris pallida TaxID=29817 RepID=A0AAX6FTK3_IRIPA|nr:ankyrin repeat-containing protein-like [Iris pallida]KAJ6825864.1 ankyrin repeat-containing protein-like [Iris pallida]